MADPRLVEYLKAHLEFPAEAVAKVLLEHGYTPQEIAEAEAELHAKHGTQEGYPKDEPPDAHPDKLKVTVKKKPAGQPLGVFGRIPKGVWATALSVLLIGGVSYGAWWYMNKPGEPLDRPDNVEPFDISAPIKTEPPEDARHLSVIGSGPLEGESMQCPGAEGGFDYWQEDIEYVDGGYQVNRAYICRIDDTFAISVTAGGELKFRDGVGVPERLDVWLHVLEEDPVLLYSDDTPLNQDNENTFYTIHRISDAVVEVRESGMVNNESWRGGKVVHLGERRVVLDTNWYGDRVEIWKDGTLHLVERVVDGCAGDDFATAPQVLGIRVAGEQVMEFEPGLTWEAGVTEAGPCPPAPLFGEPEYDEFFTAVSLTFGQEGVLVLDANSLTGRFLLPDGSLGSKWATYDAGHSGFVMSYPSDWGLSAATDGTFCFSDVADSPTPGSDDCLDGISFRAPPPGALSCSDYYLANLTAAPRSLGDIDATQFSVRFCEGGSCGSEERYVVACRNDAVYEWALRDFAQETIDQFDEMLERFRFTSPFTSIGYPPSGTEPASAWDEWGSAEAGFHIRIPGEPTANRCNPGSEAHFLCISDLSGNGNVYRFGGVHPWSGAYGGGEFSCGQNFDDCIANIRSGDDGSVITQKTLAVPGGIRAVEVLIVEPDGDENRWLVVEYTNQSGAFVMWQSGLDAATNQIYSSIVGTIAPW